MQAFPVSAGVTGISNQHVNTQTDKALQPEPQEMGLKSCQHSWALGDLRRNPSIFETEDPL